MKITTSHAGVKRGLDALVKKPRDKIVVEVLHDGDRKEYRVTCDNLLDLAHAVPGLSSDTADIQLGG